MENINIPTAKDFLAEEYAADGLSDISDIQQAMIQFAKMHVKAALESATKNATLNTPTNDWQKRWIEEESILNAYPLDSVK